MAKHIRMDYIFAMIFGWGERERERDCKLESWTHNIKVYFYWNEEKKEKKKIDTESEWNIDRVGQTVDDLKYICQND